MRPRGVNSPYNVFESGSYPNKLGCVVISFILIFILSFNFAIGGLATEYVFEEWMSYTRNESVDIAFWKCGIAGIFIGELAIPAALVTWIINPYEAPQF